MRTRFGEKERAPVNLYLQLFFSHGGLNFICQFTAAFFKSIADVQPKSSIPFFPPLLHSTYLLAVGRYVQVRCFAAGEKYPVLVGPCTLRNLLEHSDFDLVRPKNVNFDQWQLSL
ncbi:hypothetical protein CEXT_368991 [Caerostris extrusa]|uniref:Uncharacterized protein n=1 Tax=Caerostris extrusa TaxID=172846 RepID=A0AAV4MQX9_CAEEX|nr:hypothetical protein CEXT_368991 [Caerostris extrusa]